MVPYRSAKKKLSKDEIIDIMKRNVDLYKNEPDFVNYIVDLAMYLLENRYAKEMPDVGEVDTEDKAGQRPKTPLEIYKVFRSYSSVDPSKHCRLCGAPTGGKMKCPVCGNMG